MTQNPRTNFLNRQFGINRQQIFAGLENRWWRSSATRHPFKVPSLPNSKPPTAELPNSASDLAERNAQKEKRMTAIAKPLSWGELQKLNNELKPRGMKFCNSCLTVKLLASFHPRPVAFGGGVRPTCKACADSYTKAHQKVVRSKGAAKNHVCCCGAPARQWAYTGSDRKTGPNRCSDNPDDYIALCIECHRVFDSKGGSDVH